MTIKLSNFTAFLKTFFNLLWLSVSSIDFYQDVNLKFRGYGIRYIFTASYLACIFCSIFMLQNLNSTRKYFFSVQNNLSTSSNLEYILNQIPNISYDGRKISADVNEPIYIHDPQGKTLGVIDPNNQLTFSDKHKLSLVFTKDKMLFSKNLHKTKNVTSDFWTLPYANIFKQSHAVITHADALNYLQNLFNKLPRVFIYIAMPFFILVTFSSILLDRGLMIILLYIFSNVFSLKMPLKTAIRLIMFTGGAPALIQISMALLLNSGAKLGIILQLLTNILLITALIRQIRSSR